MRKEDKAQLIETLAQRLQENEYIYIADISGLNAEATSNLRRLAFKKDVQLFVTKNTLLKKAMEQSDKDFSALYETLKGDTCIMMGAAGNMPAKLIKEYRKDFKNADNKPALKGAYIEEGTYVGEDMLETLANVKSKNELIADVIALLQSPAKNVVSALQSGGSIIHGVLKTLGERAE
ncbi:MAG: 50S ribosomal protein L10 [Bacteroidales bacterium]|nr:50S ribosomal protein L10 [Bacteroidales bacterium]